MRPDLLPQRTYWNAMATDFHAIYTHKKSGIANVLDSIFRADMYQRFDFTMRHCEPVTGRSFLDVGCGSGEYSVELAKRGASKVVGIDIAENMLALSQELASTEGVHDRCTFHQTDLLDYQADGLFDVTFGIGLFDYIRNPSRVLQKMREVSRHSVIVAFPRFWTWRAPMRKVRLFLRGCPVFFYKRSDVERLMKDAGLESCEVITVGKLFCVIGRIQSQE